MEVIIRLTFRALATHPPLRWLARAGARPTSFCRSPGLPSSVSAIVGGRVTCRGRLLCLRTHTAARAAPLLLYASRRVRYTWARRRPRAATDKDNGVLRSAERYLAALRCHKQANLSSLRNTVHKYILHSTYIILWTHLIWSALLEFEMPAKVI